jgi:hypothetical protein
MAEDRLENCGIHEWPANCSMRFEMNLEMSFIVNSFLAANASIWLSTSFAS